LLAIYGAMRDRSPITRPQEQVFQARVMSMIS
jgi:hypothetical protein